MPRHVVDLACTVVDRGRSPGHPGVGTNPSHHPRGVRVERYPPTVEPFGLLCCRQTALPHLISLPCCREWRRDATGWTSRDLARTILLTTSLSGRGGGRVRRKGARARALSRCASAGAARAPESMDAPATKGLSVEQDKEVPLSVQECPTIIRSWGRQSTLVREFSALALKLVVCVCVFV